MTSGRSAAFWGKILLPMGAFLPMAAVGGIYDKVWPALAYLALVLGLVDLCHNLQQHGKAVQEIGESLQALPRDLPYFFDFLFSWLGFRGF